MQKGLNQRSILESDPIGSRVPVELCKLERVVLLYDAFKAV